MPIDNSSLYKTPCDFEAEQAVLGAIILKNNLLSEVAVFLSLNSFHFQNHGIIYQAMLKLSEAGSPIDEIILGDKLKELGRLEEIGGYAYLAELTDRVPTSGNVVYYARILHELSLLRDLITATSDIGRRSRDPREKLTDLLIEVERRISDISQKRSSKSTKSIHDVICDSVTRYEDRSKRQGEIIGIPTMFANIDRILLGLTAPDLITIAADSGVGKTTLALNFIENIYTRTPESRGAFICSREMANYQLTDRMICSAGKIDSRAYKLANLKQGDMDKMVYAADLLSSKNVYFNDELHSVDQIIHEMRHLHKTVGGGLCIAVVDYVQLLEGVAKNNREQEIAYCSRSLKGIAKELSIVVIQLSQLNRDLRKRQDKRPIRSDLRECVTGDTIVCLGNGMREEIKNLVGQNPIVLALSKDNKIIKSIANKIWKVGVKEVFKLTLKSGREIKATGKHRFLCFDRWEELENLKSGERIATSRIIPEPETFIEWSDNKIILLAHLIGDGSYVKNQSIRYTTGSEINSKIVSDAAINEFSSTISKQIPKSGNWHCLSLGGNGNRWHPKGIKQWLRDIGVFGQGSYNKCIPMDVFSFSNKKISLFLSHLWATDGNIYTDGKSKYTRGSINFTTCSDKLSKDVMALLLRLGILSRRKMVKNKKGGNPWFIISIVDVYNQKKFIYQLPLFGEKKNQADKLIKTFKNKVRHTNVDTIPNDVFEIVKWAMRKNKISQRKIQEIRGVRYGGEAHFKFSPSRNLLLEYANILNNEEIKQYATNDIFWDEIKSIESCGDEEVFDITVPGPSSWVSDGIISHNSAAIEHDSDIILFLYRDDFYNEDSEMKGFAEVDINKNRNGDTGRVFLKFIGSQNRFLNVTQEEKTFLWNTLKKQ